MPKGIDFRRLGRLRPHATRRRPRFVTRTAGIREVVSKLVWDWNRRRLKETIMRHRKGSAILITWLALLILIGSLDANDVTWLDEVRKAPVNSPHERIGKLAPLLVDDNGQAITTREGWEQQRRKVRDDWRKFLGPMPEPRPT